MKLTKCSITDIAWDFSFAFWFLAENIYPHGIISVMGLLLFLGLTFGKIILRDKYKLKIPGVFLLYSLFVLVCYINIWLGYSINRTLSYQLCVTLWRNFIFLIAAYYYVFCIGIERLKKVFIGSVAVGSVLAFVISIIETGSIILRGEGSSFNANTLAISAALAICFMICSDGFKLTPKSLICLLILGAVCVFSGTRKSVLTVAIIIIVYVVIKNPKKLLKNAAIISVVFIAMYVGLMKIPVIYNAIGNRVESMFSLLQGGSGDASAETRNDFIALGLKYFKTSPWLGNGINCFKTLKGAYGTYSHNNYVELLFGVGILGTVAYYSMFIFALLKAVRRYMKCKKNDTVLCIAIIFALLFIDIALVSYYERTNLVFVIFCYVLLKNDNKREKLC